MSTRQRIGDLLVAKGLITRATAEIVAVEAVLADTRFASVLVAKKGAAEADVLAILSDQKGVPAVDLAGAVVLGETINRIPDSVARRHTILPLRVEGGNLLLAMADPDDQRTVEEVGFATGLRVLPHVALHQRLRDAIRIAYAADADGYTGPTASDATGELTPVIATAAAAPEEPAPEDAGGVIEDEPLELDVASILTSPVEPSHEAAPAAKAAAAGVAPAARPASAATPVPAVEPAPATRPAARLAATATSPDSEPERLILVVDDETDILQLVSNALGSLGHRLVTATRGLQALQIIKAQKPDLIILDAMLPEVHGFEICRKIKESKRFRDTPVLMISAIYRGWRIAADIEELYGVNVFLEKPFRVAELRRRVTELLVNAPKGQGDDDLSGDAAKRYETAVAAYKLKDYAVAFRELREAEGLEPFSAKIQFLVGRVLERQDRAFQAIYHYERAVELNPSLFPAAKNLALLYQNKGFRNKAVEMWERSLRAAPTAELREQIKRHLVSIL